MGLQRQRKRKIEQNPEIMHYIIERIEQDPTVSTYSLAAEVNEKFGLDGDSKISHMAVARFLKDKKKSTIKERFIAGEDIVGEFKNSLRQIIDKTDQLLQLAENSEKTRDVLLILEQQRKNLETLVKYGQMYVEAITEYSKDNLQDARQLILSFANSLCPECKVKILNGLENGNI